MVDYFIYYASYNIVGFMVFGIMLLHDCMSIDRQEKQLKYDHALLSFMLYFLSDAIWAGVDSKVFPANMFTILATDLANYIFMTAITYHWLVYVMALEQLPRRNSKKLRFFLILPLIISVMVLIVTYLISPKLLLDDNLKTTPAFDVFLVCVPYVYVIAVILYTTYKAIHEKNLTEKKKHLYVGFFPVVLVIGGLMQMILMPQLPIFCFSSTILMVTFYIQAIDARISTDPLTKLNNRGQLMRYVSQAGNMRMDGRITYVVMMDINDFKKINDTYGHAEGDQALVILAQTLMNVVHEHNLPMFLGRYGGDEFVMIVHAVRQKDLDDLLTDIREGILEKCKSEKKPYLMSVGIGFDELLGEPDTFQKCLQRADSKLYLDKEYCKLNGKGTILS